MANEKVQDLVRRLREVQAEFQKAVEQASGPKWQQAPAEGEWSPAQVVAHMCESPGFYASNVRKMVAGSEPSLARSEADMAASRENFAKLSKEQAAPALALLKQCDAEVMSVVSGLTDDALSATGVHPRRGIINVEQQIESIINHYKDHIGQIQTASK
jgi:hypothetical protein